MSKVRENRIPFGLRDGALVEVSDVESGLACMCVCPSCEGPLQARKGKKRSHYFAHDPSAGEFVCASAFETSIHLMAKEILKQEGSLEFPGLTIRRTAEDQSGRVHTAEMQVESAGGKYFERVELEKRLDDIRPDIIAYIEGQPFIIEVAVTSFVGEEKKQRIWNIGLPAIEIDLSSVSYASTKVELRDLIYSESTKKEWLSNPKAIEAIRDLKARLESEIGIIDESIRRDEQKALARASRRAATARKIHTIDSQEKTRWFVCKACGDIFELLLSALPPSLRSVPCPSCGASVSVDAPRINS